VLLFRYDVRVEPSGVKNDIHFIDRNNLILLASVSKIVFSFYFIFLRPKKKKILLLVKLWSSLYFSPRFTTIC